MNLCYFNLNIEVIDPETVKVFETKEIRLVLNFPNW